MRPDMAGWPVHKSLKPIHGIIIRYAMERTSDFIKVWFWPRLGAPSDVQNGDNTLNTDSWVSDIDRVYHNTPRCDRID